MMGKDCERILGYITQIKDAAQTSITSLATAMAYQIKTIGSHGEEEINIDLPSATFVNPIKTIFDSLQPDITKMKTLESGLYTSTTKFNNSYGSPWKELNKLEEVIETLKTFQHSFPILRFIGEKSGLMGLLQLTLTYTVDIKWALITYHDYIQRGYDTVFNGNRPSIAHKKTKNKYGIGNVKQKFDENVNIPDDPEEVF